MPAKPALSKEDLEWFRRKRRQSREAEPLWDSEDFHRKYGNGWVALAGEKVEFHSSDADAFVEWLDANDPRREKFLVRFVPSADAEFAFPAHV